MAPGSRRTGGGTGPRAGRWCSSRGPAYSRAPSGRRPAGRPARSARRCRTRRRRTRRAGSPARRARQTARENVLGSRSARSRTAGPGRENPRRGARSRKASPESPSRSPEGRAAPCGSRSGRRRCRSRRSGRGSRAHRHVTPGVGVGGRGGSGVRTHPGFGSAKSAHSRQTLGSIRGVIVRTLPSKIRTLTPSTWPLERPIRAVRPSSARHEGEAGGMTWLYRVDRQSPPTQDDPASPRQAEGSSEGSRPGRSGLGPRRNCQDRDRPGRPPRAARRRRRCSPGRRPPRSWRAGPVGRERRPRSGRRERRRPWPGS